MQLYLNIDSYPYFFCAYAAGYLSELGCLPVLARLLFAPASAHPAVVSLAARFADKPVASHSVFHPRPARAAA